MSKEPIKSTLRFRGYRLSVWVLQEAKKKKNGVLVNEMNRAEKSLVRVMDVLRENWCNRNGDFVTVANLQLDELTVLVVKLDSDSLTRA